MGMEVREYLYLGSWQKLDEELIGYFLKLIGFSSDSNGLHT